MIDPPKRIIFNAANEQQARFLYSQKRYLMLSGAVAAGKSLIGCYKGFLLNYNYPGNRGLICRKESVSLKGSTVKTLLEQVVPPEIIVSYNQMVGELWHKTRIPGKNSCIVFSGLDKKVGQSYPTKIGSTEFGWIFVDEGVELDEGDWMMLSTRLRYKLLGYSDEQNSRIPRQMFTATNPDTPHHWLYKFFFGKKHEGREVFLTTPYDNPYLPAEYLKALEESITGIARERLLLGKWVIAEGLVYSGFDPKKHVFKDGFLDYKDYKELVIGADANYPIPRAAVLIGIRGDGGIDVLDEFYRARSHVEELGEWIGNIYKETGIVPVVYHDPSDPEAINKLRQVEGVVCKKADNTVLGGISEVSRYFDSDKLLIRINSCCVNLIKELHSYRWEQGKVGQKPKKVDDHCVDGLRYALYSHKMNMDFSLLEDSEGVFF